MRKISLPIVALALIAGAAAAPAGALVVGGGYYWRSWGEYVFAELQGSVPGLVTVDMSYPNAEHNVRALTCVPFGTGWSEQMLVLHDRNRDDPHQGTIRWGDLSDYPVLGTHEVSRTGCAGSCRLTIPPLAWNEVLVLAGFSFEYQDFVFQGNPIPVDARVEEIMVRPRPYNGWIDVAFDNGSQRPFDVWLAYVRIPASVVAAQEAMTSQVPVNGIVVSTRPRGPAVLQGFYLGFTNGGHPLHRFTIDLSNDFLTMRWRDLDGGDLFNWSANWVRLVN
jgi:hypothetical protein